MQPVGYRPIVGAEQGARVPSPVFSTKEKITRLAIQILSVLAAAGAILLGACVVVNAISTWHILSALGCYVACNLLWARASRIIDFNDPAEVERLRGDLLSKIWMTEMLEIQPIDTIINYNLVPLLDLRSRCLAECVIRKSEGVPVLRQHADGLLRHKILSPELHRIIIENDLQALELLPRDRVQFGKVLLSTFCPELSAERLAEVARFFGA